MLTLELSFFQAPFFDMFTLEILTRFALNLVAIYILLFRIYFPTYRNKDYVFTLALFNVTIFMVAFLLNKIEVTLGFAFGLFAVFTMLRYRTQTINTKNMTFLVLVIGLALIHSVSPVSLAELLVINAILLGVTYLLNSNLLIRNEYRKTINYEKIDLIKPEREQELIEDLRQRTGLNIHRVAIGSVDFMRDTARVRVFYYPEEQKEDDAPEEDFSDVE